MTLEEAIAALTTNLAPGAANSITPAKLRALIIDGLRAAAGPLDDYTQTAPPTVDDDEISTAGNGAFSVGSKWFDTTAGVLYVCRDATERAAIWMAEGAGAGLTYTWDEVTTASDPSTHNVRGNNVTQGLITALYMSETSFEGAVGGLLTQWFASSSATKAHLLISEKADRSRFIALAVTAHTDSGAYRTLACSVAAFGSAIRDGATVNIEVMRAGDASTFAWSAITGKPEASTSTGQAFLGIGAGASNTGTTTTGIGQDAAGTNAGGYAQAVGAQAAQYNSGTYLATIGYQSAQYNTANFCAFSGGFAGQYNSGLYTTTMGYYAGSRNSAANVAAFGTLAAQMNAGIRTTAVGYAAALANCGPYSVALGYNAGQYNEGDYLIAIGHATAVRTPTAGTPVAVTVSDTGLVTFDSAHGITVGQSRLYQVGGGTAPAGTSLGTWVVATSLTSTTMQIVSHGITSTGASVMLAPNTTPRYSNAICIGNGIEPTASNEARLGNSSVTIGYVGSNEIWTAGNKASIAEVRAGVATKGVDVAALDGAQALVTLTDAATISVDMATFANATVTLAGNRTLGSPTNERVGQRGVIFIVQDGTGNRTLAYGSEWKFPSGTAPVLSTAAGAVDMLRFVVRAAGFVAAELIKDIR